MMMSPNRQTFFQCTFLAIGLAILGASLFPCAAPAQSPEADDEYVTMDFQDVDLVVLVKFISELTGKNFIIDEKVRGKVTVISPTKITKEEAYQVFESVLDIKGFTTVPAGKVIKIVQARDAVGKSIETLTEPDYRQVSDRFITRLLPLQYVSAEDAKRILDPLKSKAGGQIDLYGPTNTLIITDTSLNINRFMKIIKEIDVAGFETVIEVIPIKYAMADVMASELEAVLQASTSQAKTQPAKSVRSRRRSKTSTSRTTEKESGIKIIPDERTNSLIVVATLDQLKMIKDLIARLDFDTPRTYGKIHVYYLQFADAEELAGVLNSLVSGTGMSRTGTSRRGQTGMGGRTGRTQTGQSGGVPPGISRMLESFESEVSITADIATNSLIVIASPQDYITLKGVIDKLDIKRRQVYVEAVFMEVKPDSIRKIGMEFRSGIPLEDGDVVDKIALGGTEWGLGTNDLLNTLSGALSLLTDGDPTSTTSTPSNPLALSSTGMTFGAVFDTITIPGIGVTIPANIFLLRALQEDSETNILSNPHLVAMDNEEAEIVVGQNVPFVTGTSQTTVSTVMSVTRENVGITLRFTPQISESDYIKLILYEEISSVAEKGAGGTDPDKVGPTTLTRTATNTVIVKDGQTIVIGGLIDDRITRLTSKVPWLGDIPFLGWFFRYESKTVEKTNLMLFLTPHILWEDEDVDHFMRMNKDRMLWYKKRHDVNDEDIDIDPFPDFGPEPIRVPPSTGALDVDILIPEDLTAPEESEIETAPAPPEEKAAPPPQDQSGGEEEPMEFPGGEGTESE